MPTLIILRHGSNAWFQNNMQGMPEGEPYLARLLDVNGNAIETLWLGAADGVNKLLGGGFQVYEGDLNKIIAPRGTAILDENNVLWTSTGGGWKQQGAGSAPVNLDCGSYW
jgi:hypothetical protein